MLPVRGVDGELLPVVATVGEFVAERVEEALEGFLVRVASVVTGGFGVAPPTELVGGVCARAEADAALALADGQGLAAIAAHRGVAIATVRSQVQSVYAKMDVHRQAELAAAVRRLSGR